MKRRIILLLLLLAGCSRSTPSPGPAISFDEASGVITINPAVDAKRKISYGFPLGSVTVETLGHKEGELLFEYTHEVEGGYTVYLCRVPVTDQPVTIELPKGGDTEPKTSFDLEDSKFVREGSVFFD
ncbi:hypothetical protein [Gimesia chilikensis]|uniref:Uncharacterized protein n=1 Tax=Gimesia chilikensis TaxID=2605989 RepID=A0A517PNP6_9PLAN|nr:hypothetical protein [Gimesia chilikensis]QDT20993.1 hypothetical protein HG66A1_27860 [Gimesia chilikensis]